MSSFKQKKVNSIIHDLLFNVSLGALTLFPLGVKAVTVIDDNNIDNYTTSGIDTSVIGDDVVIKTTSATAPHIEQSLAQGEHGLYATDGKSITVDSTDNFIINNTEYRFSSRWIGIRGDNYSNFTVNSGLEINNVSDYSKGIDLSSGAHAVFNGNVTINNANDGYKFTGIDLSEGANAVFNKKVALSSTEDSYNFTGITIEGTDTQTSNTTGIFNDDVVINVPDGNGVSVDGSNIALTFNGKATINVGGDGDYGIALSNSITDKGNSLVEFKNGLDLNVPNGTAITMSQQNGKLNIFGGVNDIRIVADPYYHPDDEPNWAIENSAGEININGKAEIIGNINAYKTRYNNEKGVVNLNLTDGSKLFGFMDNDSLQGSQNKGDINLNLSGSQSQWKMTGNSVIDTLTLSDDAKVSFGYDVNNPNLPSHPSEGMTLTTDSLAGNGVFEMRTAIATNLGSDLLKITGAQQATGNHQIIINDHDTGSATVTGNEKIKLVETNGGDAKFGLFSSAIDIGGYEFNTLDELDNTNPDGKDWILSASSKSDNSNNGSTDSNTDNNNNGSTDSNTDNNNNDSTGGSGTKPKPDSRPNLTNTAKNAANILNSNYLMNYVETQTLLQRMGQIRTDDTESGKVWGRIYTGKLSSFNDKRLSGFDMDYYGLQLGLDRKLDYDKVNFYYGIMGGLSRGEVDHNVGDGSTKSYSLGLYGTLQSQNGFYLDGLVKYMHMSNKFNSMTAGGYHVKGDGNTNGFSIGAEVGKRIHLSNTGNADEGWYLEPQAQLTYSHQDGATINATNGLSTRLDSYDSLIGRASLILGYTIQSGKNPVDIYFKTGYLREFKGETSYTFNQVAKEKYDFGGNWWDNGVGVNMRLNGKHNLYGDVVYSAGNKFDQKQVNVGYRYNF